MSLDNNKVLAFQDYHCALTALPIKKRPVIAFGLRLNELETSERKPFLTILQSSAPDHVIQPLVETALDVKGSFREPKVEPKEEPVENIDLSKIVRCDFLLRSDIRQPGLELAPSSKEDLGLKRDPPFQPVMESVKAVLDLNLPGNAWDDYSSSSVERNGDIKQMATGVLLKNMHSSELSGASTGATYARLRKCSTQSGSYDFGLGALSSPSSRQDNSKVTLDLQLKPPCRAEPRFNWADISSGVEGSDAEGISLGLSLLGSCKLALGDTGILKDSDIKFPSADLASALHVKSGSCNGDESLETAGPGNIVTDSFGSTTLVSACNQAHGHSTDIGDASPPDKKVASVMYVPQHSCDNRIKKFYNKSQTSCGDKVKDFYNNFDIDLNIPLFDSAYDSQAPANPRKPLESSETSAEVAREFVTQDQYADNAESQSQDEIPESSSLFKEANGLAANNLEVGSAEVDPAEDVNGADGSDYIVSHGNKAAVVDVLSGSDSILVDLNCNGFVSLEVQSVELPMEMDRKSDAADSGEEIEIEEFEEEVEEVSVEGSEEIEEVVEEVSCDNDSDNSLHIDDDENTEIEEIEIEEFEEVSCEDPSDGTNNGEVAENTKPDSHSACSEYQDREEESALHVTDGAKSILATIPPAVPLQNNIKEHTEFVKEKKEEATILDNLQPSVLGVSATVEKSPLKRKHDWGTKPCINKDIVKADEEEVPRLGWERQGAKSGSSKEIAETTEQGDTNDWGTLAKRSRLSKATEEGCMNQGGGSLRKQSDAKTTEEGYKSWEAWGTSKEIAEATEKSKENDGWGTWETTEKSKGNEGWGTWETTEKSKENKGWGTWETIPGPKGIAEEGTHGKVTEKSKPNWRRGTWEAKSGTKDIARWAAEGSYRASRRENTRRPCSPPRKGGRIITFKRTHHERSYYEKRKPDHERPAPSHVEGDRRERFSKSFRHNESHRTRQRDDRYNKKFYKPENNRDGPNRFGMRKSDYAWFREDQSQSDDALHCDQEYADMVPLSQRQSRKGDAHHDVDMIDQTAKTISLGPNGGCSTNIPDFQRLPTNERRVPDFQRLPTNERRVVRRDFSRSSPNHSSFSHPSQQYPRAEDSCANRNYSPNVIQGGSTDPCGCLPSPRPFEHPSRPWLRSPETPVHDEMQISHHNSYCPHELIAPMHDSVADDERETNHCTVECTMPARRSVDIHPQQIREDGFGHTGYYHGREQSGAGSSHERHLGMQNSPSRPALNRDIRSRLGNASNIGRIADSEFSNEVNYGVQNGTGPDGYSYEQQEYFQRRSDSREHRGNVRDRIGRSPTRGRGMRGRFHGRGKVWHDPDSRDVESRRY